jgi:hypothetical protein
MSRRRSRRLATLLAAAVAVLVAASAQATTNPSLGPVNLRVTSGEGDWNWDRQFRLARDRVPGQPPVSAVHYLVLDEAEEVARPVNTIAGDVAEISPVRVPPQPGRYTAEVWLEGPGGETGPPARVALRFDNVRPGTAQPLDPGGWIGGNSRAAVQIEHPAAPLPVSGIRGYAVSIDRGTGSSPCEGETRCTLAETDLSGGINDDRISVGVLPEGSSFLRVVAVSGSGMRSASAGSARLRVDTTYPEVELRGASAGWSNRPLRLNAVASDALSGMAAAGPAGPYTAIAVDDGVPTIALGEAASALVRGDGAHSVAFFARDLAGNVSDGEAGAPAPARALIRIDETPPRVAFARTQDPLEPERIEAVVSDTLSGPNPRRGMIEIRPAGSHRAFEQLPTVSSEGKLVSNWESDRYPAGTYEFRATGYDAAGNASVRDRRLDGARMVLTNPLKKRTELVVGFGESRRARTVAYGRGAAYGGRLVSAPGRALPDLPVVVTEIFADGADPERREIVARTRPDGSFRVHLPPGPSRQVQASFPGTRLFSRSSGPPAQFEVRSSVRLRTSARAARIGGAPIVFSGKVGQLDTSIPAGGLPVELQFRLAGSEWSEFRTVQADPLGRFHYSYAFSDDDSRGVRFQFRAHLAGQLGWPYEPASSRPVLITGR